MRGSVGAGAVLAEAKARASDLQLVWADDRHQGPLVAQAAAVTGLRAEVVRNRPANKASSCCPGAGL